MNFQNMASISMTFPGLEKENGIPFLFQVFHDWIHPATKSGASFTKGLSLDLDLKLRLLSLIKAKSVVLNLVDFTKQQTLSFG